MEKILLDVTTIITFISDICSDPSVVSRYGDLEGWKNKNMHVYNQLNDELKDPVWIKLKNIFDKHELVTTKLAKNKVENIINKFGSSNEINKLKELFNKIVVIEDDPSDIFDDIDVKMFNDVNISVFGTAYKHNITVISGNVNIISYIRNEMDIPLKYIAHRPRCFVGKKLEIDITL